MTVTLILMNAIRLYLLDSTDLKNQVGTRVWKWYIRPIDTAGTPLKESGLCALVLKLEGGDTPTMGSLHFPNLNLRIYADDTRNAAKEITKYNKEERMDTIFRIVDGLLHWVDCEPKDMSGIRVLNSFRATEPRVIPDDVAGMNFMWVSYSLKVNK